MIDRRKRLLARSTLVLQGVMLLALLVGCGYPHLAQGRAGVEARVAEDDLLAHINAYRRSQGLAALRVDAALTLLAKEHSQDMRTARRLSHQGFESRFRRSASSSCVENVGWNHPNAQAQFQAWVASSGHNQNLLATRTERAGIGVAGGYVTFFACN
jgi:uncharacterized protein YkwD